MSEKPGVTAINRTDKKLQYGFLAGTVVLAAAVGFVIYKKRASRPRLVSAPTSLRLSLSAAQITAETHELVRQYQAKINGIVQRSGQKSAGSASHQGFLASFGSLADADGHAALISASLTLPALVSPDADARKASSQAKVTLKDMWDTAYARPDLYECLKNCQSGARTEEEKRLAEVVLSKFRQSGATLKEADRQSFRAVEARCMELASKMEQAINEDVSTVLLSEQELEGCGDSFIQSLPKHEQPDDQKTKAPGSVLRVCSFKAPVLLPVMARAKDSEARRKMAEGSAKRCVAQNSDVLTELLTLRHQAAQLLGFENHAERMIQVKMARSADVAKKFVEKMLSRLAPYRDRDTARLLSRKKQWQQEEEDNKKDKQEEEDNQKDISATVLNQWDVKYFSELLKREQLELDDEQIKEFFPLKGTITRILEVYSEMLSLRFELWPDAPVWHPEVVCYKVSSQKTGALVGHLYLDQFPRPGKYGHQMVVPLTPSFVDTQNGIRCVPACVNISNLARPEGDRPALLRFAEMKTLFHELGHCMHCLCTDVSFAILSWAWPMVPWPGGVEQDFLELPSMALEKLVFEPALLARLARHYSIDNAAAGKGSNAPVLGQDTIDKIKALDRWMVGMDQSRYFATMVGMDQSRYFATMVGMDQSPYFATMVGMDQSRYFAMALFDLIAHAGPPPYSWGATSGLSLQELYRAVYETHTGLRLTDGAHPCASWYHLCTGYDAGYYGYGWADVFAADVYEGLTSTDITSSSSPSLFPSPTKGAHLRDTLLAPCASRPAMQMLTSFLGRAPSEDAWLRRNLEA
eukprot:g75124.t1